MHKDLLRAYDMFGTVLGAEDNSVNDTDKNPWPLELTFYKGQKDNKHETKLVSAKEK